MSDPHTTTLHDDIKKVRRVLNWFKDGGRAEPEDEDAPDAFERVVTALVWWEKKYGAN